MYKIAVVNSRSFGVIAPDVLQKLQEVAQIDFIDVEKTLRGKALAEKLEGYHFIIASVTPLYDREFFENNRSLLLIARHGIGYDNVDVDAATEQGVIVTRVPGSRERDAVAELAVALCLNVARKVCQAATLVREGKWAERGKIVGVNISGKTVGIIGLGNIGSRVAEIFSRGFNAKVVAYDPFVGKDYAARFGAELVDLDTLLRESDIILLHAPLTKETYHMIGEKEIDKMKKGVIVVNTARGELIDTNALIKGLESGKIAGVGLDVVEGEPIGADHPLLKYRNVVITPHIGANTYEGLRGMDEANADAILKVIRGEAPLEYMVNPEVLKRGTRANLRT
ncbi:D-isomer specific 2-hydroxyacid dehydrogenase family protein [Thermofilum pendens]|uniref:D-isomer specific 2-hydroxyacid dehydrogenase, NAD-binding n=1 Tax=Thermofilum pendens (strain DSM 2475 / Hrk 5) TaxID=368408 RepID=A1S0N8_THEPD|nr:D-isomer specific 2-hydroxyacid dehydrogenase family protein [Thermofilum pendens]ABL79018.1 D-isomer specific 2-hydroxyacid dehydrogenase, NAD-binding [Thermofilum pendens Hrk 5]